MATSLVLTFIGRDRPGLVNALAAEVTEAGGNWLESRLARLAGEFAGIVLVSVPDSRVRDLRRALGNLEGSGLRVTVNASDGTARRPSDTIVALALVGHDRPGIVRNVTEVLLGLGISIEEFASDIESAPFTGDEMFRLTARLAVPKNVASEELRSALERLAGEIMVDVTVEDRREHA